MDDIEREDEQIGRFTTRSGNRYSIAYVAKQRQNRANRRNAVALCMATMVSLGFCGIRAANSNYNSSTDWKTSAKEYVLTQEEQHALTKAPPDISLVLEGSIDDKVEEEPKPVVKEKPSASKMNIPKRYWDQFEEYRDEIIAAHNDSPEVPIAMICAIGMRESGLEHYTFIRDKDGELKKVVKTGKHGEKGILQVKKVAAAEVGITNLDDPGQNLLAGTRYLHKYHQLSGSWTKALHSYNGGYKHVKKGTVRDAAQAYAKDVLNSRYPRFDQLLRQKGVI